MRMRKGADWREAARIVQHMDPDREPDRARQSFESHLARAKWITKHGYRHLLQHGWPVCEPEKGDARTRNHMLDPSLTGLDPKATWDRHRTLSLFVVC
jgi:hypothetical protein